LAAFGVTPHGSDHVPSEHRCRIATFTAPPRHSFEPRPADAPADRAIGRPVYLSSHGLRPGDPGDDRFCAFYGGAIARSAIERAAPEQFAATAAALLGLPLPACHARSLWR
jgi:predicted AlkP superfamily pyrophosphatase or phosphodiesterase